MEKQCCYKAFFETEENTVYHLEYSLLIQSVEQRKYYGVAVRMTNETGASEEDAVMGLCENREKAEQFLLRLKENLALPIELTALCDDFISEWEMIENQMVS